MLERIGRFVWKFTAAVGYVTVNLPWIMVKLLREGPKRSVEFTSELIRTAEESVSKFQTVMEMVKEGQVLLPELPQVPFKDVEVRGKRIAAAPRMPWDVPALILQFSLLATVVFAILEEIVVPPVMVWEALAVISAFVTAFSLGWLRRVSPSEDVHWRPYWHSTLIILGFVVLSAILTNVPPVVMLVLPLEGVLPGFVVFGLPALGVVTATIWVRKKFHRTWTFGVVLRKVQGEGGVEVTVGHDIAANTLPGEYVVEGNAPDGTPVLVEVEHRGFSLTGAKPVRILKEGWW
ncbi:DUF2101 family protein [Methanopyrus sp.]